MPVSEKAHEDERYMLWLGKVMKVHTTKVDFDWIVPVERGGWATGVGKPKSAYVPVAEILAKFQW